MLAVSTRASAVAQEIRRLVLSGDLPPGTRLRQDELAKRFEVSTTPVREALTALAREGLVRYDAHRGVIVFSPSVADLRENYEIRGVLESFATQHAAAMMSSDDLKRLDVLIAKMGNSKDIGDYQELNREFHRVIYQSAKRPRLLENIETLRDAFEAYVGLHKMQPDGAYVKRVGKEHAAIAAALGKRDGDLASKLMAEHIQNNERYFDRSLQLHERRTDPGSSQTP